MLGRIDSSVSILLIFNHKTKNFLSERQYSEAKERTMFVDVIKINTKTMQRVKDKKDLYRKYTPTMIHQPTYLRSDPSYEPSQCNTVESAMSNAAKLKQTIQGSSSRIADEVQPFDSNYDQFRNSILKKVVCIEEEANTLLEKKERQMYFLKIQLQNNEARLLQAEEALIKKDQEIERLKQQLDKTSRGQIKGKNKQQYSFLVQENIKLKQSLNMLIKQKNDNWRQPHDSYSHHNQPDVDRLKKEVEQLRTMVGEMEQLIHNCPSCFTLSRNLQQLNQSYACLLKEHTKLKHFNQTQEQHHLKNITKQIQENQNIVRENNHLRGERDSKYYLRPRREKLKDSVAKRCRTLTDQF